MTLIFNSSLFSLLITIGFYLFFSFISEKLSKPYLNPLALSGMAIILVIQYGKVIKIESYMSYSAILTFYVAPLIVALAVPLYHQRYVLLQKWPLLLIGTLVSVTSALVTTIIPARLLRLDEQIIRAMAPKSVTTPIALELTERLNGLVPLAAVAVVISGITGYMMAPIIFRLIRKDSPIAQGFALGGSSHILGVMKSTELGELQAACATVAVSTVGIAMTIILPFIFS